MPYSTAAQLLPFIGMTDVVNIIGDPAQKEYLMLKKNRVYYIIRNIENGLDYKVEAERLIVARKATDKELDSLEVKLNPLVRVGAVVTAVCNNKKWTYAPDQKFVVLSIRDNKAKIVVLYGSDTDGQWGIQATSLTPTTL